MLPIRSIRTAAVLILFNALCVVAPAGTLAQGDESLESEFRQLRDKLSATPEFSGADAESTFRLAEELAHRGDMQGAIDRYRAAIRLKPDWGDPYRGLGQVLLDHHDYAEAVNALQSAVSLGRGDHLALYWLGRAFMGTGRLSEAAQALGRALELQEEAETAADLALVKMAQGDAAGAEDALTRSIRLKPDYADAHELRDRLAKTKGDKELTRQTGLAILHDLFGR
jgi:tetratricopeptide (TPR) repeat protein